MAAQEMGLHSELPPDEIAHALKRALNHLRRRAAMEISARPDSDNALQYANDYRAISELINTFGTQLIAFEDLDVDDADRIKN